MTQTLVSPDLLAYEALAWLSLLTHETLPEPLHSAALDYIAHQQTRLQTEAEQHPAYQPAASLVAAECARLRDEAAAAAPLYDAAIDLAQQHQQPHMAALALELAGRFYLEQGRTRVARSYLRDAHHCYQQGQHSRKVAHLERHYAPLLHPSPAAVAAQDAQDAAPTAGEALLPDRRLLTALQQISSELEVHALGPRLLETFVDYSQSQRGVLLLEEQGTWTIAAEYVTHQAPPIGEVPHTIVQQVARTRTPLALPTPGMALHVGGSLAAADDPYLAQHQIETLLCLPLLHPTSHTLMGIVYLEHAPAQPGDRLFTADDMADLRVLAGQAASAVQHALRYQQLQATLAEQAAHLENVNSQQSEIAEALHLAQFALDRSMDGIYWLNRAGEHVYVNDAAAAMAGFSREELLGFSVFDLDPTLTPEEWGQRWERYQQQGSTNYENRHHRRDGSTFPVEVTTTYLTLNGTAYLCSFTRDTTERKQAEEALRESEERYRKLVTLSPFGINVVAQDGELLFVNQTGAQIAGYNNPDDLIGRNVRDFVIPTQHEVLHQRMHALMAGQRTPPQEYQLRRSDEQLINYEVVSVHLHYQGQPAFLSVGHDVTEQKRIAETLSQHEQALAMLRERERMTRELHDTLGQVLGYINTQAQAVRELLSSGRVHMAIPFVTSMVDVAQEAQSDVRDFIAGTRAGMELHTPDRQTQGLVAALHQHTHWLRHAHHFLVELLLSPAAAEQHLSPLVEVQLLRIIQEALNNARKHAGVQRARLELHVTDQALQVTIADEGSGFDAARLAGPGAMENYGIQSMHGRAEEIGGSVEIASTPGEGTTVQVRIPLHQHTTPTTPTLRLLLVDDNELFLSGLRNMLEVQGWHVVGTAANGAEALSQAHILHPDVILMDVDMPGVNGLEAIRHIRAQLPDIQIVMLTVADDDETLFEAIRNGAMGYLTKNLSAEQLYQLLHELARGEAPLSPGLAARVLRSFADSAATGQPDSAAGEDDMLLNDRQREVLTLVAQGHTYREVARRLNYSESSIKYHMGTIVRQLHLKDRAAAVAYARQRLERGFWQTGTDNERHTG